MWLLSVFTIKTNFLWTNECKRIWSEPKVRRCRGPVAAGGGATAAGRREMRAAAQSANKPRSRSRNLWRPARPLPPMSIYWQQSDLVVGNQIKINVKVLYSFLMNYCIRKQCCLASKFIRQPSCRLCCCLAWLLTGPFSPWSGERWLVWCGAGSGAGPGGGGRPGGSPPPPRPPLRRSPAALQDSPHQSSLAQGNRQAGLGCNETTTHLSKYLEKYGIQDF